MRTRLGNDQMNQCRSPIDEDLVIVMVKMLQDCLLLNIYVPAVQAAEQAADKQDAALPVMVWLHGGAFLFGQG